MNTKREEFRSAIQRLKLPAFAPRDARRPFVLALEGPNGAGKSTLCQLLARELKAGTCLGTDRAWFSDAFKVRMIRDAEWHASALFFLSGCFEQMRLLRGRPDPLVVMDRSLWSTLAVHAATDLQRLDPLLRILGACGQMVEVPDITLVLQASFATCQSRIAQKSGTSRSLDELTASTRFHAREEDFYQWLGRERPELVFLDVNQLQPEQAAERAVAFLRKRIPC
jgi:thymidylate kinase